MKLTPNNKYIILQYCDNQLIMRLYLTSSKLHLLGRHEFLLLKYQNKTLKHVIVNKDIVGVKFLIKQGHKVTYTILVICCQNGTLNILKILLFNQKSIKTYELIDWTCYYGHLNMVKYLLSLHHEYSSDAFDFGSKNNHLHIIKYLLHINPDLENTQYAFDSSCKEGNLNIIKLLKFHGVQSSSYASDWTCIKNNLNILKYVSSWFIPRTYRALDFACKYGHVNIIKYLFQMNDMFDNTYIFNMNFIDNVENRRHKHDRFPTLYPSSDKAIKNNHLKIVKFLEFHGFKASDYAIEFCITNDDLSMLKYLIFCGYRITSDSVSYAFNTDNYKLLGFLLSIHSLNIYS